MNQQQATLRIAHAIEAARGFGIDHVATLARVPDTDSSAILVRCADGSHLSVTVEVLAAPHE